MLLTLFLFSLSSFLLFLSTRNIHSLECVLAEIDCLVGYLRLDFRNAAKTNEWQPEAEMRKQVIPHRSAEFDAPPMEFG